MKQAANHLESKVSLKKFRVLVNATSFLLSSKSEMRLGIRTPHYCNEALSCAKKRRVGSACWGQITSFFFKALLTKRPSSWQHWFSVKNSTSRKRNMASILWMVPRSYHDLLWREKSSNTKMLFGWIFISIFHPSKLEITCTIICFVKGWIS